MVREEVFLPIFSDSFFCVIFFRAWSLSVGKEFAYWKERECLSAA